jgi:hypothetical protein
MTSDGKSTASAFFPVLANYTVSNIASISRLYYFWESRRPAM